MGTFVHRRGENMRALRIETVRRDFIDFYEISDPGAQTESKGEAQSDEIGTGRTGRPRVAARRNPPDRGGDFIHKE